MSFKSTQYQIAYRKIEKNFKKYPLEDVPVQFVTIPNSFRYWAADPFLWDFNKRTFLFCELFDFNLGRGVIGYSEFKKGKFTKYKPVIVEDFHLSYPLIFEFKNDIYMMPETNEANSLLLYKAVDFPEKWEKCKIIKENCRLVDTTIFPLKDDKGFEGFSSSESADAIYKLKLDENLNLIEFKTMDLDAKTNRNGGSMIDVGDSIIRVCQDCRQTYGYTLIFRKLNLKTFEEMEQYTLSHKDIVILNSKGKSITPSGIHTYNANGNLEVIDIKRNTITLGNLFYRLLRRICK
ncbi:MAG: hypothetical protein J6B22_03335 [Clostridia bacterium]|nr:hypothetical protein [Clostridia bacterium]